MPDIRYKERAGILNKKGKQRDVVHVFKVATSRNLISKLTIEPIITIETLIHSRGDWVPKTAEI